MTPSLRSKPESSAKSALRATILALLGACATPASPPPVIVDAPRNQNTSSSTTADQCQRLRQEFFVRLEDSKLENTKPPLGLTCVDTPGSIQQCYYSDPVDPDCF